MKILFISGEDYCALTFKQQFRGVEVLDVMNNIENYKKKFLEENEEYKDDLDIEVKELNIDEEAYLNLRNFFGDSDYMKSCNTYLEDQTF